MCCPVNFAKFLRTSFLTEQLWTTASLWTSKMYVMWTFRNPSKNISIIFGWQGNLDKLSNWKDWKDAKITFCDKSINKVILSCIEVKQDFKKAGLGCFEFTNRKKEEWHLAFYKSDRCFCHCTQIRGGKGHFSSDWTIISKHSISY